MSLPFDDAGGYVFNRMALGNDLDSWKEKKKKCSTEGTLTFERKRSTIRRRSWRQICYVNFLKDRRIIKYKKNWKYICLRFKKKGFFYISLNNFFILIRFVGRYYRMKFTSRIFKRIKLYYTFYIMTHSCENSAR